MKKSNNLRLFATLAIVLVLLTALSGCHSGKNFDSPESMISEMTGTYTGSNEHSGERIVINGSGITKFNIDDLFPDIKDDKFFLENFSNEDWETFDIDVLLSKSYIKITTEPISTNIEKSTICDLWIDKNGVLYDKEDHPYNKISSDSNYPTSEMQVQFEKYHKYLKEYEISSITAEAENNLSSTKESLKATLSSATSSGSGSHKSTASAETIATCAFESLEDYLKYPLTAKLDSYLTEPLYDSYGRVCTLITVTAQNGFGNYITEKYYVVLQSCSYTGRYTYTTGGMHFTKKESYVSSLLAVNEWDTDPNTDYSKEDSYNKAIQLMKDEKYELAVRKLGALGDYKSSVKLKEACVSISIAEKYKKAIDLFVKGEYGEASKELSSLLKDYDSGYLRAERVIALCNIAISNASGNAGNASGDSNTSQLPATQPPATEPSATQPPATQPPATQPPATQPPATQPPATQAPTVCSHNYATATCTTPKTCTLCGQTSGSALGHTYSAATCTAPQTCTLCGQTSGSALGHTYSTATCTTPQTCNTCGATSGSAAGHKWTNITQTVHHEEQGHYGDVEVVKYVEKYKCYACSNKSNTLEDYYSHFDSVHGNSNHYLLVRDRYEIVNDKVYEYETQWIVDQEAYTETVVTGRKCDACGEED